MARLTFDTSFIISYRLSALPDNFYLSAVVITEITAGANSDKVRKQFEAIRRDHERDGTLIVPMSEDWLLASRVLYWLAQGRKREAGGKAPPLRSGAAQRMLCDALIAISAARAGVTVVTVDWDDFKAIQYYHRKVKLMRASDFLK